MKNNISFTGRTLRTGAPDPLFEAVERFRKLITSNGYDALFTGPSLENVIAWDCGGDVWRPVLRAAMNEPAAAAFIRENVPAGSDCLISSTGKAFKVSVFAGGKKREVKAPAGVEKAFAEVLRQSRAWEGRVDDNGDYVFDPRTPSPGSHFRANLLIGDRCGFANPLLTAPKAVTDGWGRGSSRSHSDKQILATRWDMLPEENGFPANRQFYLIESGEQVFYSASPGPRAQVQARHSANSTSIHYLTADGLAVERKLFVVPSEQGLPMGVEAQIIEFENMGKKAREISAVVTGMLGFPHPGALTVDVVYTLVTVEPRLFVDKAGSGLAAVAPRYSPPWGADDQPFNLTLGFDETGKAVAPSGFCLDYQKFVGNGSLEKPQNAAVLDNSFPKKGPSFYAVRIDMRLRPGAKFEIHSFNGLISRHEEGPINDALLARKLNAFAAKASSRAFGRGALKQVAQFQEAYNSAFRIQTPDEHVNHLVNRHLPFQVRYQSYASRSFSLTQKGFRQIGFREIQDIFAGMIFECGMGRQEHIKELIGLWAGYVYRFGYADHQFYWSGIEPGRYSDDALWLFQAVGRYIDLTGDATILDTEWPVAGEKARRKLIDTLEAVLNYSGKVSVGRNGLPLIDHADWNDTFNLDGEGIPGPEKETLYKKQLRDGAIKEGEGLQSDMSESVMNGFLLEVARQYMVRFAAMRGDRPLERHWADFGETLRKRLQAAWKGDFFARCMINRQNKSGITYMGASGDGMSADPKLPGSYHLNSFSWSVLSGIATEEQVRIMLDRLERAMLTPFGLRLSSPTRFDLIMPYSGVAQYFYGDRENGGVFKHANMMACAALIKASKTVKDRALAEKLLNFAWKILMLTAPFTTFKDPYRLAGNPRFCTQYANPSTHEHIGPLVSGTAPWMWLSYLEMMGVEFKNGSVSLDPVLPSHWTKAAFTLNTPAGEYSVKVSKPKGFYRSADGAPERITRGSRRKIEIIFGK